VEDYFYQPPPKRLPMRLPRRTPKRVVPSYIGKPGQVLNMLMYRGGGDAVRDCSGEGNDGDLVNAPTWVDGPYGWSVSFVEANSQYVNVPHDPSLAIEQTDMTLISWVYLDVLEDYQPLLPTKTDGNVSAAWDVYGNSGGTLTFRRGDGTNDVGVGFSGSLESKTWLFLGIAQSGWDVTLYKNGSAFDTLTMTSVNLADQGTDLKIGTRDDLYAYLDGDLKMVSVYNETKSASFINGFFEDTRAIFGV